VLCCVVKSACLYPIRVFRRVLGVAGFTNRRTLLAVDTW